VGLRVGLDVVEKRKKSNHCLSRELNHSRPACVSSTLKLI